jgi:hypothetical protein
MALSPASPTLAGDAHRHPCPATTGVAVGARHGYPAAPAHLRAGFYAQSGRSSLPPAAVLCRVRADVRHPLLRTGKDGCDLGAIAFLIPDDSGPAGPVGSPAPRWGTFLPPGWYFVGMTAPARWTEVCWFPRRPPPEE